MESLPKKEVTGMPVHKTESTTHNVSPDTSAETSSIKDPRRPDWRLYLAFMTLSTMTLMVALDATSLSVALAVCPYHPTPNDAELMISRPLPPNSTAPPSKPSGRALHSFSRPPSCNPITPRSHTSLAGKQWCWSPRLLPGGGAHWGTGEELHLHAGRPGYSRCWWGWDHCSLGDHRHGPGAT